MTGHVPDKTKKGDGQMKERIPAWKKALRLIPALLLAALLCMPAFSGAAAEKAMTIKAQQAGETTEQVTGRKNKSGYILSIPGAWDITQIRLSLNGQDSFILGKKTVEAGTPVDLTPYLGKKTAVYNQKKASLGNVTIYQGSKIPAVFFTVDEKQLKKINHSKNEIITEGRVAFQEADGSFTYNGDLAHLKGRGNNTFSYSKKPYEFKLAKKADLSGMGKAKTWILLANYVDVSLLRNQIVLDISQEIGLPYAVECQQVDVWQNGIYTGLYLMTEKVQINKHRINITDLEEQMEAVNDQPLDSYPAFDLKKGFLPIMCGFEIPNDPEDITGGYIAVIEKPHRLNSSRRPGIRTEKQLSVRIKEPTCPSLAEVEYFGRLVNDMHNAILAGDGVNPDTGKHYTEYLDIKSFAGKFLVEEFSKNYDAVSGSQYFFKDSDRVDPLIYAGPSWDYDLSFGNMESRGASPSNDYLMKLRVGPTNLYSQLARHDDFMQAVGENWREKFRPALAILTGEAPATGNSRLRSLDEYSSMLKASAAMNAVRWGAVTKVSKKAGTDFESGVKALKSWIKKRIDYLDKRYAK